MRPLIMQVGRPLVIEEAYGAMPGVFTVTAIAWNREAETQWLSIEATPARQAPRPLDPGLALGQVFFWASKEFVVVNIHLRQWQEKRTPRHSFLTVATITAYDMLTVQSRRDHARQQKETQDLAAQFWKRHTDDS